MLSSPGLRSRALSKAAVPEAGSRVNAKIDGAARTSRSRAIADAARAALSAAAYSRAAADSAERAAAKACADNVADIEHRLRGITLADLVLGANGKITPEELSRMSTGEIFALVSGGFMPVVAAAVADAVHGGPAVRTARHSTMQHVDQLVQVKHSARQPLIRHHTKRQALLKTSRGNFRQTLSDVIGPLDPGRSWREEFKPATDAGMRSAGLRYKDYPQRESLEKFVAWAEQGGNIGRKMGLGYSREEAELLQTMQLAPLASEIGAALAETPPSPRYSALTHAGYNAIARHGRGCHGGSAPRCFWYMHDSRVGFELRDSSCSSVAQVVSLATGGAPLGGTGLGDKVSDALTAL